jgi:hypothetical protein
MRSHFAVLSMKGWHPEGHISQQRRRGYKPLISLGYQRVILKSSQHFDIPLVSSLSNDRGFEGENC